jgi:hypothetical protein
MPRRRPAHTLATLCSCSVTVFRPLGSSMRLPLVGCRYQRLNCLNAAQFGISICHFDSIPDRLK